MARACLGAFVVGLAVAGCSSPVAPAPRTASVDRAAVSLGVTAPGSVTALTEQNLGFPTTGQLTTVSVRVGDHVEAGQPLATIDDFAARQALATQQAQLASQQAALAKLTASPAVAGARAALDQATSVLDAVKDSVDAVDEADGVAIDNAKKQLDVDENAADDADDALEGCVDQARSASSVALLATPASYSTGHDDDPDPVPPACATARSAATAAEQKVVADRATLASARQKRDVDKAAGQLQIQNARQTVVTAQNAVDSAGSDRPHNIDAQQALVDSARAAVDQAQRTVENTTLKAPVAGTVSVLNGAVGEFVAPSSGTSALAPGSAATIPGAGGASGGGSAAAAGASRPGGTQFIVLDDIDQFQVVAPFNESDVASIAANQKAEVTFDAIPDLTVEGTVVSVSPTGTSIAGVISYYVTIALTTADPRLRSGQTANAGVVTSESAPDSLSVPSRAVRRQDGRSVVTVAGPSGPTTVAFTPGVVGVDRTEVVSGLQEGQQVLLPIGQ